ncbi:MAG: GGDEF domain-containing protein [bacterium]|nr:GGDEF domain-containing protein [bacterium]MCM1374672.1 GGDEF domain-containing protein [Muribaculum sp.]
MGIKYSDGKDYKVIAFILANFYKDEQIRIIKSAIQEAGKHHCKLVFFSTLSDFYFNDINDKGEQKIFSAVSVERFDAVVLMSETFKQDDAQLDLVERARCAHVPVITVDKSFEGCINLVMNYVDCFREIVEHMILHHGYRRVYFMGGMPDNSFSLERERTYWETMEKAGIPSEQCRVYYGAFWEEPCRKAMRQMFADIAEGLEQPEAIICANDSMALEVCSCLKERGLRVPEDIAVSGFDGIEMARYHQPQLTTGIYNYQGLSQKIFEVLDEDDLVSCQGREHSVPNAMQLGQSCGCEGKEEQGVTNEIVALKGELKHLLKYQGDLNQMVVNFGMLGALDESLEVLQGFMGALQYRDFWFCANDGFLEEDMIDFGGLGKAEETEDYTQRLRVKRYHNIEPWMSDGGKANVSDWVDMEFGEIIPNLHETLGESDYLLVAMVHLQGKSIGYTVASFDSERFWYNAYSAFLASFRHLMELQRSRSQLVKMYMKDLLTGLYNRNGFYHEINSLLEKSGDMELSIISLDMDGLKQINDTYGHAEGDAALQSLGTIIKRSIRQEFAARIGGDEFLIALAGRDIGARTAEIIDKIRQGIQAYNEASDKVYAIQASIGSYTDKLSNHTLDYFIKKADDLMYHQKFMRKREQGIIK